MNRQIKSASLFAVLLITSLFATTFVLAESGKNLKLRDSIGVTYDDDSSHLDSSLEFEGAKLIEDGDLEKSIIAKTEAGLDQRLYRGYPTQVYWGKGWSIDSDKKEGQLVDFLIAERVFVTKNNSEETRVVNGALRIGEMLYTINDKRVTSESLLSENGFQLEVKGRNSVTGTLKLEKKSSYTGLGLWEGTLLLSDGTDLDLNLALKERDTTSATRPDPAQKSSVEAEIERVCGQYNGEEPKYGDCKEEVYKNYLEDSKPDKVEQKQERVWQKFFDKIFGRSRA